MSESHLTENCSVWILDQLYCKTFLNDAGIDILAKALELWTTIYCVFYFCIEIMTALLSYRLDKHKNASKSFRNQCCIIVEQLYHKVFILEYFEKKQSKTLELCETETKSILFIWSTILSCFLRISKDGCLSLKSFAVLFSSSNSITLRNLSIREPNYSEFNTDLKAGENQNSTDVRVKKNIDEINCVEICDDEIAYPVTQHAVLEPILSKFSVPERENSKHDTMAVEFLRLCTMHNYPNTNGPSLLRLAQAGFFYEGNECFSCDFRKGSWNYSDSPREIHLRMSPNCKFLSQGGDGNVPVPREESTQDLVPLQSFPQIGVVEPDGPQAGYNASTSNITAHLASANYSDGQDQPDTKRRTMVLKHPEYASRPARLASYANFPRHMKQHPADMTDAGFYYAGFGDCCRCFHCGIGLRNWDPEYNPWIEHARWSMECPYILKIKGQAFIDLVQEAARAAEMAQDDEDSEAERTSAAVDSDFGTCKQEKSGASNSSPSGGPAANEIEINVAKTSEATMSKGSSDDSGFGLGGTPVAKPIKAPLRTAAAQSLIHDEKIKPKYVTAAIEDLVNTEGWGAFTKENIWKYLKIHEENRKSASSASNADPNMLKQENKELKDLTICKICLDEKVSIVFLPCGHLVSCPQCAPALTKCPICRKNIKGTLRTSLIEKSKIK